MRSRLIGLAAALLVTAAGTARAQQNAITPPPAGSVDFGFVVNDISGDPARFQHFRDWRDGPALDRFRYERQGPDWAFQLAADHAGRRDQRFFGRYQGQGRLKISFEWNQVPLFNSRDTQTLYTTEAPGVFRLADTIQQGIETGGLSLSNFVGDAARFETRSRRDTARLNLVYSASRQVDFKLDVKTTTREGTMPWGTTFGFSNTVELAAPIDTRTTDVTTGLEWANPRGMVRVGYTGSWFDNRVQTLVWDNPRRMTDSATAGASQGRLALWPSSSLQAVTTAGSVKLPAHSRASANVSIGRWNQNEPLLPFTVNAAIAPVPLSRETADASARTLAMNYTLTSRPHRYVWLNARYRYYDFDNTTPSFEREQYVHYDQTLGATDHDSEPLSVKRQNLDLDASFTPFSLTAFKVGYGREQGDRTFRIFGRTIENVFRASVDRSFRDVLTVRAIFERANRTGSHFEPEMLAEVNEQPAMRHFDIADRTRNRVSAVLQVTPIPALGFSATLAAGKDDYRNSGFGLRDNENRAFTLALDAAPVEGVGIGLSYANDRYTALQNSRTASPGVQFTDPTRDWSIDSSDQTHTIIADLDVLKLIEKTELRFAYSISTTKAAYVYGVPADSTIAAPQQLPSVRNELHTGSADLRYFLTSRLAAGVLYWYDRYQVNDFALGPQTIDRLDLPSTLLLGYVYRPYTANSVWLRLMYLW